MQNYAELVHVELVLFLIHVILLHFPHLLLLGLRQQLPLVLLLVVALVLGLEHTRKKTVTDVLRIDSALLNQSAFMLPYLLPQRLLNIHLVGLFLLLLLPLPLGLGLQPPLLRLLHELHIDLLLLHLPLLFQVVVVLVYLLVKKKDLPVLRLEVVLLYLLVQFLHLLVALPAHPRLLVLLPQLQVQRVHHLLPEHRTLVPMLFLRLLPDLQVIPAIAVPQHSRPPLVDLGVVELVHVLPLLEPVLLACLLALPLCLRQFRQVLRVDPVLLPLQCLRVVARVELVVQLLAEYTKRYR